MSYVFLIVVNSRWRRQSRLLRIQYLVSQLEAWWQAAAQGGVYVMLTRSDRDTFWTSVPSSFYTVHIYKYWVHCGDTWGNTSCA